MRSGSRRPFDAFRRAPGVEGHASDSWKRETFVLPRGAARIKAREILERFPRAAYLTEVEFWRELDDGRIEFTMLRLPTSD